MKTIFTEIIEKTIPGHFIFEDDKYVSILDKYPIDYGHSLVIPKKPITKLSAIDDGDLKLMGHLLLVVKKITTDKNISDYRVAINNGAEAGQTVFHLHLHILAGRTFGWPPG